MVIEIWKSSHRMELRRGDEVIRDFEVGFGRDPEGTKQVRGDKRTPVGEYFVTEKHHSQRFHRFIGLSYPNIEDANRGYESGLIGADQWAKLFVAIAGGREPAQTTLLGGRIGIHGFGGRPYVPAIDWTDGCIAVSNEESEFLYENIPVGTKVRIHD